MKGAIHSASPQRRTETALLGDSGVSNTLVDPVVRLARAMNLKVIAEGVQIESQLALLTGMPQPAQFTEALLGLADEAPGCAMPRVMPNAMPRAMRRG